MKSGVNGVNTRTQLVNRDNELAFMLRAGGRYALVQNDPDLCRMAAGQGVKVIYRESGDAPEDNPLDQDAAGFVQKRADHAPDAEYIHLLNEIDPSPEEQAWLKKALAHANSINRKCIVGNYATHRKDGQWKFARPLLAEAARQGHAIGVHAYLPGGVAEGAMEWLATRTGVGGVWIATEFAYGRYVGGQVDPHRGWRGITTPSQRRAFIEKWSAYMAALNVALLWFCYDFWDKPTVEIAKAEGFGYNDYADVGDAFHDFSTVYQLKEDIPMPVTVTPPPANLGDPFVTTTAVDLNLRGAATTSGAKIRLIPKSEAIIVSQKPRIEADGYIWAYTQDAQGNTGYTAIADKAGIPYYDPPLPPIVVPPPPDQTYPLTKAQYQRLAAVKVQIGAQIEALDAVRAELVSAQLEVANILQEVVPADDGSSFPA